MRGGWHLLVLAALVLVAPGVQAAQLMRLTPELSETWLSVRLEASPLEDPRIRSTIESGLPGHWLYEIEVLNAADDVLLQRIIDLKLHYDPWDQIYFVNDGNSEFSSSALAVADSLCAHPAAQRLMPRDALSGGGPWRVRGRLRIRAISAAAGDEASQWVKGDESRREFQLDVGGFFRRLLQADPAELPWVYSATFRREVVTP